MHSCYANRAILALCLLAPLQLLGQTPWTGVVDPARAINWSNAGAAHINDIRSQCGSTIAAYTGAPTTINNALASCAANGFVLLGPGTFNLNNAIIIANKSNVTLRGSGSNSTFLIFTGKTSTGPCSGWPVCAGSTTNAGWWSGGQSGVANWLGTSATSTVTTGTYTRGGTFIKLDSVSGLTIGDPIILDQLDDQGTDNGNFWVGCEFPNASSCSYSGTSPSGFQRGTSAANVVRGQEQMVNIVGITGTGPYTVQVSPGIYADNWRTSQTPQAWWVSTPVFNDGFENMSIDVTNAASPSGAVYFWDCTGCWVKGVRTVMQTGTGTGWLHVGFAMSNKGTVRDSYFYGWDGDVYGVGVQIASDILEENNIGQLAGNTGFHNSDCEGCVVGYNFNPGTKFHNDGSWLGQPNDSHSIGLFELYEGNINAGVYQDSFHGTHMLDTYFRNRYDGKEPNINTGNSVVSFPTSSTVALRLNPGTRYQNLIANVLGTPGYHTIYKSAPTDGGTNLYASVIGCGAFPEGGGVDANVCPSSMFWGNWDNVTNAVRWNSSEVPSGISQFPNAVPGSHTLPASFYYTSKPAWFPSAKAWPLIGPDVTGGNVGQCVGGTYPTSEANLSGQCTGGSFTAVASGTVTSNPAMDCYLNVMHGLTNGSGAVSAFDSAACYSGAPSPPTVTLSLTATNGAISGITANSYTPGTLIGPGTGVPNTGYSFSGWTGTGSASTCTTGTCSFTINVNSTLTASFTANSYNITTATAGSGTGTVTGCSGSHVFNTAYSCTATPTGASSFGGWSSTCGGSASGTTYSGNMQAANCSVTATFNLGGVTVATGDTRTVPEPTFPTVCAQVQATKYLVRTTLLNVDPYNPTCGSISGTNGVLGCKGGTSYEPSSTASPTFTSAETLDNSLLTTAWASCPTGQAVELVAGTSGQLGFVMAPFSIPTGKSLIVDAGVSVKASRNRADFGGTNCGLVTTASSSCNHWITSPSTTGSGIYGYGTFDARGWDIFTTGSAPAGMTQGFYYNRIQAYCNNHGGAINGSPACTVNASGNNSYGPNALNLVGAKNFTLYKTTIQDAGNFIFNWQSGDGLTAWGVKLIAPFEVSNTDGFDPLNSQNGTFTHGFISNGDNHTAFKAKASATKNITIDHTQTGAGIAIAVGTDINSFGVSNILVQDIVQRGNLFNSQSTGIQIGSSTANGGVVDKVTFQRFCSVNEKNSIRFYTNYGGQTGSSTPIYTNILGRQLHFLASTPPYTTGKSGTYTFQGLLGHPMSVQLDNVVIDGTNEGIAQQSGVTKDQYAGIFLGPGAVDSSLLTQFAAGTSVITSGSSGTSTPYACNTSMWQPLIGELNLKTATRNNNQSYTVASPTPYTLQVVLRPATEINSKESPALTAPVSFLEDGVSIGSVALTGDGTFASLTLSNPPPGTHTYTARYPGDSNYAAFSFGNIVVNTGPPVQALSPSINPSTGSYVGPQTVTLFSNTPSAAMCYTIDNSTPTGNGAGICLNGTLYTGTFVINSTTTIKAIATKFGNSDSNVTTVNITITTPTVANPSFSPTPNTYTTAQNVTLSDTTSGVTIYYTVDGTTPTTSSSVYSAPIPVSVTTTIKAFGFKTGSTSSAIVTGLYTISPLTCGDPVQLSPNFSGGYTSPPVTLPLSIGFSSPTAGCALHCVAGGGTPNSGSPVVSFPLLIGATWTERCMAAQAGYIDSGVQGGTWTINSVVPNSPTNLQGVVLQGVIVQ
jgi:uncharacterized repeat protein (TIGR02543 family)